MPRSHDWELLYSRSLCRSLQLVQLVVERLQADAENFRGARLVVARVLERHHDQPALGLFHRRARPERDLRLMLRRRLVGERRRQVLGAR